MEYSLYQTENARDEIADRFIENAEASGRGLALQPHIGAFMPP